MRFFDIFFLIKITLPITFQNLGPIFYHQFHRNLVVDILEFWNIEIKLNQSTPRGIAD